MDIYELVRGPLAWIALLTFVLGSLYRIVIFLLTGKKEPALDPSRGCKDAARSILHGLIPFGSAYMRRQPVFATVSYIFHLCVVIIPIYFTGTHRVVVRILGNPMVEPVRFAGGPDGALGNPGRRLLHFPSTANS